MPLPTKRHDPPNLEAAPIFRAVERPHSSPGALLRLGLPHSSNRPSFASISDANLSHVLARSDHIFLASGVVAVCAKRTQSSACWRHSLGSIAMNRPTPTTLAVGRVSQLWELHRRTRPLRHLVDGALDNADSEDRWFRGKGY
jgi:hypothetical protein